jgi:hypothetical protein
LTEDARKTGKIIQNPCRDTRTVYRKAEKSIDSCDNFELEGSLCSDNRWVIMAKLIPWSEFELEYASLFSEEMGATARKFSDGIGVFNN